MKLPKTSGDLARFARDTIDECYMSRETRRSLYRRLTSIYYTGTDDGEKVTRNMAYEHVDKMSSYLFSPAEVRFVLDFEESEAPQWKLKAERGARYFNRQFSRRKVHTAFSMANEWALVKGATIMHLNWNHGGLEPWVIQPDFFGVRRDDVEDLDRQDAFVRTTYMTETELDRLLADHRDRKDITSRISAAFDSAGNMEADDYGPGVTFGAVGPANLPVMIPGVTQPSPGATGKFTVGYRPNAILAPQVAARLVELHELWVWDDEREDYTTVRYADPGVLLEGKYQRRNLCGLKAEHPFRKVCSNPLPDNFWGWSDIDMIIRIQKKLNGRIENIDQIYRLQAQPSRTFRGFQSMTDAKAKALLSPGGVLSDSAPASTTSVDAYAPQVPQGYLEYIDRIGQWAQEAGGFTAILSGQGEPGVRSGNHADTILRTSTPRLRDRALLIEQQAADVGDLGFHLMAAKDARVLKVQRPGGEGEEFTLAQLPDDVSVQVDSHTSSPAFSGEAEQKMFALNRAGAVGPEDLIRAAHVPMTDHLVEGLREREAAHSKEMAELKAQDPEAWVKAISQASRHH